MKHGGQARLASKLKEPCLAILARFFVDTHWRMQRASERNAFHETNVL